MTYDPEAGRYDTFSRINEDLDKFSRSRKWNIARNTVFYDNCPQVFVRILDVQDDRAFIQYTLSKGDRPTYRGVRLIRDGRRIRFALDFDGYLED